MPDVGLKSLSNLTYIHCKSFNMHCQYKNFNKLWVPPTFPTKPTLKGKCCGSQKKVFKGIVLRIVVDPDVPQRDAWRRMVEDVL